MNQVAAGNSKGETVNHSVHKDCLVIIIIVLPLHSLKIHANSK